MTTTKRADHINLTDVGLGVTIQTKDSAYITDVLAEVHLSSGYLAYADVVRRPIILVRFEHVTPAIDVVRVSNTAPGAFERFFALEADAVVDIEDPTSVISGPAHE